MNILFIAHGSYPCKIGGAEIFNYYLIKALSKYYKIFVLTTCKEEIDLDVTLININPRKLGIGRISIPFEDLLNIVKLRNKIDLIHISYMRASWLLWFPFPISRRIFDIPYLITIHGGGMHEWKPRFPHKFLFKNAAAIVGVSQRIKEEYERRTCRDIKFIPPLIPFKNVERDKRQIRHSYGFEIRDTIILTVGSIKKIKGSNILLTAFINLGKRFVEEHRLKLLFVGDGIMRIELEEITEREDFSNYVFFWGNMPHEKVASIYAMSDIYIIPSLFEGTPIAMLEAMFNKMPIIGSNANGINDIIQHGKNGLLFESDNSDDLNHKIKYLIENKDKAEKISARAKEDYHNKYSFETIVDQYKRLYEGIR